MGRGGLLRRGPAKFNNPFVPRFPFDLILCESAFPRVTPAPDEAALTDVRKALLIKNYEPLLFQYNAFFALGIG
jgi:hypothetical protein